jgi:ssDNA-binding Zn-finger/Zn-ribbon topoisomerase 1
MKRDKRMLNVYNELHNNFHLYINLNRLSKKCKIHWLTCKDYVDFMNQAKLFHKPICEWHDEDFDDLAHDCPLCGRHITKARLLRNQKVSGNSSRKLEE